MKKNLKYLLIGAGALIALLLVAAVLALVLIDPNDYRDTLSAQVKQHTGRELKIKGPVSLKLFPRLGVHFEDLDLASPPAMKTDPLLRLGALDLQIAWLPLFSGKVHLHKFHLDKLQVHLLADKKGQNNWTFTPASAPTEPSKPVATKDSAPGSGGPLWAGLSTGSIEISRSQLRLQDQSSGQDLQISKLNLNVDPVVPGKPSKLDLKSSVRMQPYPAQDISLQTRFTLGTANDLALDDLVLALGKKARVRGRIAVDLARQNRLDFNLNVADLDLDSLLPPKAPETDKKKATRTSAPASSADAAVIPVAMLRSINADGKLMMTSLKVAGLRIDSLDAALKANAGNITLAPLNAALYEGKAKGSFNLNAKPATPRLAARFDMNNVQLGGIIRDMDINKDFSGKGQVNLDLTTQGQKTSELKKGLNGKLSVNLGKGELKGADFVKVLRQAREMAERLQGKEKPVKKQTGDETVYEKLSATAKVVKGVVQNDDLVITSPQIRITGKGNIDLPADRIDYLLKLREAGASHKDPAIPVKVKGPLSDPEIVVQYEKALKKAAERELRKKGEKALEKELQKGLERFLR